MAIAAGTAALILGGTKIGLDLIGGGMKNLNSHADRLNSAKNDYRSFIDTANQYIRSAEDLYGRTRDAISNTYGADVFGILESQYNSVNSVGASAVSRGTLTKTAVPEKIDLSKEVKVGFDYDYENRTLTTGDFGDASEEGSAASNLYNLLSSGDTALAQSLRLSGNQMKAMLETAFSNATNAIRTGVLESEQYALNRRAQTLEDTQWVAQAKAAMATSGFRNTGAVGANEHIARLQADMNEAAYAIQTRSLAMQLRAQIEDLQKSSSLSAYEMRASDEIQKRRAFEEAVGTYREKVGEAEQAVDAARNQLEMAEESRKAAKDLDDDSWLERLFKG